MARRRPTVRRSPRRVTIGVASVVLALAGCRAERVAAVRDAEIRPAIAGTTSAAYFVLDNAGRDTVVVDSVTTPAARVAELHETTIDAAGVARMRPVGLLTVPPDSAVRLRPGSLHLMLIDVTQPLTVGRRVSLTLWLRGGSTLVTSAEVRAP